MKSFLSIRSVLHFLAGCLCSQPIFAQVIISHSGSTDPTTEGWTLQQTGSGQNVGSVNDAGTPAWQVQDTTGSGFVYYTVTPDAGTIAAATEGWILSGSLRLTSIDDSLIEGSPGLAFITPTRAFGLHFGTQPDGDPMIVLRGLGTYTHDGGGSGYHSYQLTYDPGLQTARFLIDGVEKVSDYPGESGVFTPEIWFGGGSTTDIGDANYASAQFTVVPEPGDYGLFAAIGLIGLAIVRRLKAETVG